MLFPPLLPTVAAAVTLTLAAGAATARCPVAGDLASGIRFVYDDGTFEVYRSPAEGPDPVSGDPVSGDIVDGDTDEGVTVDGVTVDGGVLDSDVPAGVRGAGTGATDRRLVLLHGVFLARYAAIHAASSGAGEVEDPESVALYTFPTGAAALPPPEPGLTWRGAVTVTQGGEITEEGQRIEAGDLREMTVGGCTFDGFRIDVDFGEETAYRESLVFLPALGIGYLAGYANNDEEEREITVVTLEAVE